MGRILGSAPSLVGSGVTAKAAMQARGQDGLQIQFSSAVWCTTLPTTSLGVVSVLRGQHSLDFSIASMAYIQNIRFTWHMHGP